MDKAGERRKRQQGMNTAEIFPIPKTWSAQFPKKALPWLVQTNFSFLNQMPQMYLMLHQKLQQKAQLGQELPRAGAPLLQSQAERAGDAQPGREKALGTPYCDPKVPKGFWWSERDILYR